MTTLACLAAAGIPATASAGGFDLPDNGARAVGRGGSYVVGVSDATAIYYNPGALSKQRGTQFLYNHNLVFHDVRFQRAPLSDAWGDDAGTSFPEAKNGENLFPLGLFAAASSDFGLENWQFGLGVFGPPAVGKHDYPAYGPQSFMLTKMNVLMAFYSATISWKYKDWFGIGVTGQYADLLSMEYGLVTDGTLLNTLSPVPDDTTQQLTTTLNLKDRTSGTAIVGLWGRPHRRVELALAARVIPVFFNATGSVEVDKETLVTGDVTVELPLVLPAKVRGGVRYIHPDPKNPEADLFDIELGAYWENWSVLEALQPELTGQISGQDLGTLDIRKEWRDTVSLRLGGDFNVLPAFSGKSGAKHPVSLTLRAGASYESAAANTNYSHLDFPSFARAGVSGGASLGWHGVYLTLGYMHVFQEKREVTEEFGKQFQERPLRPCPDLCDGFSGVPANAGTFTSRFDILSLGFDIKFRELLGDRRKRKKGGDEGQPPPPPPEADEADEADHEPAASPDSMASDADADTDVSGESDGSDIDTDTDTDTDAGTEGLSAGPVHAALHFGLGLTAG